MGYLEINGFTFAASEVETSEDGAISQGRHTNGKLYTDALYRKRAIDVAVVLKPFQTFDSWRRLLEGRGHVWSFDETSYSSKGLNLKTTAGATIGTSSPSPKFGNGRLQTSTDPITVELFDFNVWTFAFWFWTGSAWQHRAVNSNGQKWQDGVLGSYAWSYTPTVSFSKRTWTLPASSFIDDLVVLPYIMPDAMHQEWSTTQAFSPLPHLTAKGDFSDNEEYTCELDISGVSESHIKKGSGVYAALAFKLREV